MSTGTSMSRSITGCQPWEERIVDVLREFAPQAYSFTNIRSHLIREKPVLLSTLYLVLRSSSEQICNYVDLYLRTLLRPSSSSISSSLWRYPVLCPTLMKHVPYSLCQIAQETRKYIHVQVMQYNRKPVWATRDSIAST